jgi:hypothetical protein
MTGGVLLTNEVETKRRNSRKNRDPKECQRLITECQGRENESQETSHGFEGIELIELIH